MMAENEQGIGYGILKPFRREATDFSAGTGKALLDSAVRTVINTRAAGFSGRIAGEYPWRKNFGSWIHLLRHQAIREYHEQLGIVYLGMALDRWEPRVIADTERAEVVPPAEGDEPSAQKLRIYYAPSEETGADTRAEEYQDSYQEATL